MSEKKKWVYLLFGLFFIFLLAQYQLVYLQFDDFGYCSLSYGYNAGIDGNNMGLRSVIDWFIHSYSFVNGRISVNLAFVLTAWLGGLGLFRVFFPLCILVIYWLIYSEMAAKLDNDRKRVIMAVVLLLSYGLFNSEVCREGLYWFAAAFGYVLPVLLLLIFIKLYHKKMKLQILLAFILCISCEQMVAMVFFFWFTSIVIQLLDKEKLEKMSMITFLVAAVGGSIMVLSPASRSRITSAGNKAFHDLKLIEKILRNIHYIVDIFFNKTGGLFVSFVLILFVITSLLIIRKHKSKIIAVFNMFFVLLSIIIWGFFVSQRITLEKEYICNALFFYFLIGFINLIILYIKIDKKMIPIVATAMASIGLLLIVPELPSRTFIPFIFMTIYIMADIFATLIKDGSIIKYGLLCIPYIVAMFANICVIYKGYESNAEVFDYNEAKLTEARELLQNGVAVSEVQLYRLIDDSYGGFQAYHAEVNFMKWWMDEFYSLPHEILYIYYDYATRENGITVYFNE